jgi:hypothetical protein
MQKVRRQSRRNGGVAAGDATAPKSPGWFGRGRRWLGKELTCRLELRPSRHWYGSCFDNRCRDCQQQAAIAQPKAGREPDALAGRGKLSVLLSGAIAQALTLQQTEIPAVLADLPAQHGVLAGSTVA